jgi:predicted nucleic acid-binding protein
MWYFTDTDVIIRLLTGDDPDKQERAAALFQQVEQGKLVLAAPDTVIADAVYVLASPRLYHLPRNQIAALLTPLVRLSGTLRVTSRSCMVKGSHSRNSPLSTSYIEHIIREHIRG